MVDYRQALPGSPDFGADKEEWLEYFEDVHGDPEDGVVKLVFIAEEEDFVVEPEDVARITSAPPFDTFT